MTKLNSYAFDASGNKITWDEWYAQCRGENYVAPASKKNGYFCFDKTHAFEKIQGSHKLHALSHKDRLVFKTGEAAQSADEGDGGAASPEATPTNNMGVTGSTERRTIELVINDKGEIVEVPLRLGHGDDSSFVDWLSISFLRTTAFRYESGSLGMTDDACVMAISKRLEYILGFGVTEERAIGLNFYTHSYTLGDKWGNVCIGGQQDTINVILNGSGCTAAAEGWEQRMFTFLSEECIAPRIARIDLTFDDIEGELYSVDRAHQDHIDGNFTRHRRAPSGECLGDWTNISGRGRTKTIGNRSSGSHLRVYEKGMQLGCKNHPWVRVELEMKCSQVLIPFDCLLRAGAYLSASYPALHWISEQKADRPKTKAKEIEVNVNKAVEIVRHQFGNYISALLQMFTPENLLDLITRNDKIPDRLKVKDFKYAPLAMHKKEFEYMDADHIIDLLDVPAHEKQSQKEPELFVHKFDALLESWLPTYQAPVEDESNDYGLAEFIKRNKSMPCPF